MESAHFLDSFPQRTTLSPPKPPPRDGPPAGGRWHNARYVRRFAPEAAFDAQHGRPRLLQIALGRLKRRRSLRHSIFAASADDASRAAASARTWQRIARHHLDLHVLQHDGLSSASARDLEQRCEATVGLGTAMKASIRLARWPAEIPQLHRRSNAWRSARYRPRAVLPRHRLQDASVP